VRQRLDDQTFKGFSTFEGFFKPLKIVIMFFIDERIKVLLKSQCLMVLICPANLIVTDQNDAHVINLITDFVS